MHKSLAALIAAAGLAVTALPALARPTPAVADDTVFVEAPTGFAFVELPAGWKFVGRVEADALDKLPPSVVTGLLPPEEGRTLAATGAATRR